jgi:hypothetical protein
MFGLDTQTIGFIEIVAGGLGLIFALGGFQRSQTHGWRSSGDRINAWGLLIFSALLVLNGIIFWLAA